MPRGRKKIVPISEKVESVRTEIADLTAQLKKKKAELKKLEKEQAEGEKAKLMEVFASSGKTADEVIAWLKGE